MPNAFYIPSGPKNLKALFGSLDFTQIDTYYIEVLSGGSTIGTSPVFKNSGCCEDEVILNFRNYLGAIDTLIFKIVSIEHETKSDSFEKPGAYPLVMQDHGVNRINVKANDIYTVVSCQSETLTPFVDELLDTTTAWLEWDGTQGQSDDYIPVIILDQKSVKKKMEERFLYESTITFKLSHDKITIRN